jgi:hypothetical protein
MRTIISIIIYALVSKLTGCLFLHWYMRFQIATSSTFDQPKKASIIEQLSNSALVSILRRSCDEICTTAMFSPFATSATTHPSLQPMRQHERTNSPAPPLEQGGSPRFHAAPQKSRLLRRLHAQPCQASRTSIGKTHTRPPKSQPAPPA